MLVLLPFGLLAITEIWSVVRDRDERGASTAAAAESTDGSSDNSIDETGGKTTSSATPIEPAATSSGGVSVDAVGGAAAVLAAFAPYAVYVALQLRTAAAIAIAVGASTLLLGALAAWVPASGVLDRGEPVAKPSEDDGASDADWETPALADDPENGIDGRPTPTDGSTDAGDTSDPAAAIDGSGSAPPEAPPAPGQPNGAGEGN